MENKHILTLVVGDWSNDGHGHTDTFRVVSSHPKEVLLEAYRVGSEIVGFDLKEQVAKGYRDSTLSAEYVEALQANGFDAVEQLDRSYREPATKERLLDCVTFVRIWMHICMLGQPDIRLELESERWDSHINIGGYGLFYS